MAEINLLHRYPRIKEIRRYLRNREAFAFQKRRHTAWICFLHLFEHSGQPLFLFLRTLHQAHYAILAKSIH